MSGLAVALALFALLLGGVPIAFALGGLGVAMLWMAGLPLVIVPLALHGALDNFVLLAVPLFLLTSNVMFKGGMGHDLYAAAQSWIGHWPGGVAIATIVSCALFAALSGSSVATGATIGTVAIPEMIRRGYGRPFVFGLLAAGGTLGILIPPSIPMIIFGVIAEESIVDLFLAGIGPGLVLAALFAAYAVIHARRAGTVKREKTASWDERWRLSLRASPSLFIAAVILLGIYTGAFTPTEAAAVGLALALLATAAVLRTLDWRKLKEAVLESARTTVAIFLILAGAKVFAKAITLYRIPQDVSEAITGTVAEAGLFVAAACAVLLIMGLMLEALSMLVIMVPVFLPTVAALGIDPIWFGVIFVIMIECALITPPVGLNLFVIQTVGRASMAEVAKGVWPFVIIMLATVGLVSLFPGLSLYIPFRMP